jgi:hypothetical protein
VKKRKFNIGGQYYEVPDTEVDAFLKDNPRAEEVKYYSVGGSDYNIPLKDTDAFESDMGLKKKEQSTVSPSLVGKSASREKAEQGVEDITGATVAGINAASLSGKIEPQLAGARAANAATKQQPVFNLGGYPSLPSDNDREQRELQKLPTLDQNDPLKSYLGAIKKRKDELAGSANIDNTGVQKPLLQQSSTAKEVHQLNQAEEYIKNSMSIKDAKDWLAHHPYRKTGELMPSDEAQNNTTTQLAHSIVQDDDNVRKAIDNTGSIPFAAIKYFSERKDKLGEQLRTMLNDNAHVPEELQGQLLQSFLKNRTVQEMAKSNPDFRKSVQDETDHLFDRNPALMNRNILSKISQGREDYGLNNPILNIPGVNSSDIVVGKMMQDGKMTDKEFDFYKKYTRSLIGAHAVNIPTPGLVETGIGGTVKGFGDLAKGVYDITGAADLIHSKGHNVSAALSDEYSNTPEPKYSGLNQWSNATGNLIGIMLPISGEVKGLQEAGLIGKGEKAIAGANAITTGLNFYHGIQQQETLNHPNDPILAHVSSLIQTAGWSVGGDVFGGISKDGVKAAAPEINRTLSMLKSGEIEIKPAIKQIVSTLADNVIPSASKDAAKVAGLAMLTKGVSGILNGEFDLSDIAHAGAQTYQNMLLGLPLLKLAQTKGQKETIANNLEEIASNPDKYREQFKNDPEVLKNIDHLLRVHDALGLRDDLSPDQKKKFQLLQLQQEMLKDKASHGITELSKADNEKIDKIQEEKNKVLNESENGSAKVLIETALKDGTIKGMNIEMAKAALGTEGGEEEFVKGVAEQALNKVAPNATPDDNLMKKAVEDFGEPIVKMAIEKYPADAHEKRGFNTSADEDVTGKSENIGNEENLLNLPSNEAEGKNIPEEENKGAANSTRPPIEESPEKLKHRYERVTDQNDFVDPYDVAVKYFADGGKINPSELERIFGGKGDKGAHISLIKNGAGTVKQIAHYLWESDETGKFEDTHYIDAVESALRDFSSKSAMQKDIVDRYDYEAAQEKYMNLRHGKEAIDIVENMSEDEMNHILQMESDETKKGELKDYIDGLIKNNEANQQDTESNEPISTEEAKPSEAGVNKNSEDTETENPPPKTPIQEPLEAGSEGEPKVTSIKNAIVDKEREKRGLSPAMKAGKKEFGKSWDEAMSVLEDNPDKGAELVSELKHKSRPLTDVENAILLHRQIELQNAFDKTNDAINSAAEKDDKAAVQENRLRLAAISDALQDVYNVGRAAGTENARGLATRQMMAKEDFTLAAMETKKRAANGGRQLTDEERAHLQKLSERIAELEQKVSDLEKQAEENRVKGTGKKSKKTDEDFKKERQNIAQNIKDKLKKSRGDTSATILPFAKELIAISPDVAKYVKSLVEQGITKLDEIVSEIHGFLKDEISGITPKDVRDLVVGKYDQPQQKRALSPEQQKANAELERNKMSFRAELEKDRLKNRGSLEKGLDTFVKWQRAFKLSSPLTLAKLTMAAIYRTGFTPLEEVVGAGIGKLLPSKIVNQAYREAGLNVKAEAKAITSQFTKGMKDAAQTINMKKGGTSDLDVMYGKEGLLPPEAADFFGHLHGALKAPIKRAEFERSFEKRTAAMLKEGIDVSDPLVQASIAAEAYKDANRSIFMQDNAVSTFWTNMLSGAEKNKAFGASGKIVAAVGRFLLPFVKVPTNIVNETITYVAGVPIGVTKLARAYIKGIDEATPEQKDRIVRSLKKGSIGTAFMLLGYYHPEAIGGYYTGKRKEGDVSVGGVKLFGVEFPKWLLHNPLMETFQIGATIRRVQDERLGNTGKTKGLFEGVLESAAGLAKEIPFIQEAGEVNKLFGTNAERDYFIGEMAKNTLIPAAVQQSAKWMDNGEKRKPETLKEHIESGIPWLRKNVPFKRGYTNEEKNKTGFKFFTDKGMDLPYTEAKRIPITNPRTGESKMLSDYPEETITNYYDTKKKIMQDELSVIEKRKTVFVDKSGDVSMKPGPYKEHKNLSDLSEKQLAEVLSEASRSAAVKTKEKLFKIK